jgi:hypothetical protein
MSTCDLCQRPATSFFSYATSKVGGGTAETPRKSVQLCAQHAALYQREECLRSLEGVLQNLERMAKQGWSIQTAGLTIIAQDEHSAAELRQKVMELCGGEAVIRSPESIAEDLRKLAVERHGASASEIQIPNADWRVQWQSDSTTSALDRWQTGGWSQRLYDLIVRHDCKLQGWRVGPGPT